MSDVSEIFLGVIAVATLVMAIVQVGVAIVAARIARQAEEAVGKAQATLTTARDAITSVREEIRPLVAKANAVADEAARAAGLATLQAQKIDRLVTDLARRVDDTSAIVQRAIITPAREGLAVVAAVKAVLAALRGVREWRRRPSRSEEEDPLFIG